MEFKSIILALGMLIPIGLLASSAPAKKTIRNGRIVTLQELENERVREQDLKQREEEQAVSQRREEERRRDEEVRRREEEVRRREGQVRDDQFAQLQRQLDEERRQREEERQSNAELMRRLAALEVSQRRENAQPFSSSALPQNPPAFNPAVVRPPQERKEGEPSAQARSNPQPSVSSVPNPRSASSQPARPAPTMQAQVDGAINQIDNLTRDARRAAMKAGRGVLGGLADVIEQADEVQQNAQSAAGEAEDFFDEFQQFVTEEVAPVVSGIGRAVNKMTDINRYWNKGVDDRPRPRPQPNQNNNRRNNNNRNNANKPKLQPLKPNNPFAGL